MNPLAKRLASGAGAFLYTQSVTVAIQLASLPLFLHYWSTSVYGEWLILSAIPAYFSLSDVGMINVAGNKMTMLVARRAYPKANEVFQSALLLILLTATTGVLVSALVIYGSNISFLAQPGYQNSLMMLIAAALCAVFGNLFDVLFRANERYALGTYIVSTARLADWVGALLGIALNPSMESAAAGYLLGRLLATVATWVYVRSLFREFTWSLRHARWGELKEMVKPAIAFMAFPAGNALSIQGTTLLVGHLLGPAAVAVINTYRTVTRILVQFTSLLSRPLWPEISRQYGLGNFRSIRNMYVLGTLATVTMTAVAAALVYTFAEKLLLLWTHGKIAYDSRIFALLLFGAAMSSVWQIGMVVLASTNRHIFFSIIYVLAALLGIGLSAVLAPHYQLAGVAAALIAGEVVLVLASWWLSRRLLAGAHAPPLEAALPAA